MKPIHKIFYTLLSFILLLVLVGLILPDHTHIERKINIHADAKTIFPHINSMKAFHEWSPWTALDPNTFYEFSGPESGIGSKMSWSSGSENTGYGSQIITHVIENQRIDTDLFFGEGNEGKASFILIENPDSTQVIWGFDPFFGWDIFSRYVGLFMDNLLGPSYETGLMNLKALIETKP